MSAQQTRIGIGVMIFKEGKILLARHKGSHGAGEYAFLSGHLDYGEGFEDCARQEVFEECDIEITGVAFLFVANVLRYVPKHYVYLTLTAHWKNGEPVVKEPDKSEAWDWYDLDALPNPFRSMQTVREKL